MRSKLLSKAGSRALKQWMQMFGIEQLHSTGVRNFESPCVTRSMVRSVRDWIVLRNSLQGQSDTRSLPPVRPDSATHSCPRVSARWPERLSFFFAKVNNAIVPLDINPNTCTYILFYSSFSADKVFKFILNKPPGDSSGNLAGLHRRK